MAYSKEQRIVNRIKGYTKKQANQNKVVDRGEERTAIATGMFLPNHSGDHSAGKTGTPSNDLDIANKKYVDDEISGIAVPFVLEKTIADPFSMEDIDTQVALGWVDNAMTISRIRVQLNADPATEINAQLKFADDFVSLANATKVDDIDTTTGSTDNTSGFDDATIPAGKFLYVEFDVQPIAAITQMHIRIDGTED